MWRLPTISSVLLYFTLFISLTNAVIINEKISRNIDVTKSLVKSQVEIVFYEEKGNAMNEYTLYFPKSILSHISYLSASVDNKECEIKEEKSSYLLKFPISIKGKGKLLIDYYLTHSLTPFPREIAQSEEQYLLYNDTHILPSKYKTTSQTTTIKLPSERLESMTTSPEPAHHKKQSVKYGPYENIPANDNGQPIQLHFPSNIPFITLTNVVKEMELSFWGKLSVEEYYEMENQGAKLRGGFSRLDYELFKQESNSINEFTAIFQKGADDVYYRDVIGNITTSNYRRGLGDNKLFIRPRFPIFGGWKTQWYMGYTLPTGYVLTQNSYSTYTLTLDFSASLENAVIDHLTVKVILPEGIKNPVIKNLPSNVKQNQTKRYTYLDTSLVGRTVLIFEKENVIMKHNTPIEIDFEFASTYLLLEPMLLTSGFFLFFCLLIILSRIELQLKSSGTTEKKLKKE